MPQTSRVQLVPDFPEGADIPSEGARPPGMSRAEWRAIRLERWEAQVSEHLAAGETWDPQAGMWRPPQIDIGGPGDEPSAWEQAGDYLSRPPRAAAAAAGAAWDEMSGGGQPHEAQWTPEAYAEAGQDGAVVQVVSPSGRQLSRNEIVMAFVKAIMRNPDVLRALKERVGMVLRPKPSYRGEEITRDMIWILIEALPKSARQGIHQYLAGFNSPLKLNTTSENYFYTVMLADAVQALGIDLDAFKNRCC